jgi:hypothetical protein
VSSTSSIDFAKAFSMFAGEQAPGCQRGVSYEERRASEKENGTDTLQFLRECFQFKETREFMKVPWAISDYQPPLRAKWKC